MSSPAIYGEYLWKNWKIVEKWTMKMPELQIQIGKYMTYG